MTRDPAILYDFSNIGAAQPRRSFPGFEKNTGVRRSLLATREAQKLELEKGDIVSISGAQTDVSVAIVAFLPNGDDGLAALGLKPKTCMAFTSFDSDPLVGWAASNGANLQGDLPCEVFHDTAEPIILRATNPVTLWVMRPVPAQNVIAGHGNGRVEISHKSTATSDPWLPPLLGDTRDEFTVSKATGLSYELKRGEYLQIIDIHGQQCSDFVALRSDGLMRGKELMIDSTATRSMVRKSYPTPGVLDKFYDQNMRPMLNVVQDTCGRHDTFGLACTARGYEEQGFPGHVNCSDNISGVLDRFGVQKRSAWPAINFFWNTWVDPHSHHLMTEESHSRPGDYVVMQAMQDLVCASTACPDDIDPINGWNPTDIHVRIYRPSTPIRRAVAYREKEDAPMSISQESAFHKRLAPLTQDFSPARDLWTPVSFPSIGSMGEYWACRNAVTLQDMSGLRKYDIVGPDAVTLLQEALTRNIAKLAIWRGTYTLMCDESGQVIDDGTLFRLGDKLFRWFCGSEESGRALQELAQKMGLQVRVCALGNSLPNLALQGPKSRDLLKKVSFFQPNVPNLDHIKWFGVSVARLNNREGAPFMLSRSGYTGELGYEIFCTKSDAVEIWDAIMLAGQEFGIQPMGSAALETIRIEAGLAAANAEFAPGVDAFEAGLGFAVDMKKDSFTGKAALERNAKDPRKILRGLLLDCDDVPTHGAPVLSGERQIGQITSATWSPSLERAIAMARISIEHAEIGTVLEVGQLDGHMKRLSATVSDIPFIDPQRKRARA
ncbi:DUF1989 domain-containing protein [Cognatishimia sp. WU-CL00825]|uniref:DUF1989 domain-containing protein n=1 Tax=Cognatishimia sp. WU-CL00825 TaxID=3127658 RepID=UPI0031085454